MRRARAALYAVAGGAAVLLLVGLPTELIPNPWFVRMIEARPQDYVFLGVAALLGAAVAATYALPAACPRSTGHCAAGGVLMVLAVGCPICNKLVVLALGTAGAMTWFEPIQPILALVAIGLLGFVLAVRVRAIRAGARPLLVAAVAGAGLLWPGVAEAQAPTSFEQADPETVGLSSEGLDAATEALREHVEAGDVAGVVAAVVRDGKLVYHEAIGYRDLGSQSPMPADALFRVYSMTRPVTALAILMLHDEGLLDVDDPVQEYLPAFEDQPVLTDPGSDDPTETRPRTGDVTLAHLLTHTSGIGSRSSSLYRDHDVHGWGQTLEEVVSNVAELPLFEDPGTAFRYGMHAEILGRVIEEVSGMPLVDFYEERIFGPLGMTDTGFHVDEERSDRLATVYRPDEEGRLQPHQMETIPVTEPRTLTSSGVGLVSSVPDFLRFSRLFLDEGRVDGQRLIGPETVEMATRNAVPDALLPLGAGGYWAGSGWSLGGFAVVRDPSAYGHTVSPGEFWWDGSAGTRFWIDPQENMITVVMAQVSPASGNGFRERFKTLVYDAILEGGPEPR